MYRFNQFSYILKQLVLWNHAYIECLCEIMPINIVSFIIINI